MLALSLSLLRVITENIAPPPLAIAHDDLLGVQMVVDDRIPAPVREHLLLDLRDTG